jgi:N utilization substance protein A
MAVVLGEAGVKTVEDLADLATDEIRGSVEQKGPEKVRTPGILDSFTLSIEEAEALILNARIQAGWIDAPVYEDLPSEDEGGLDDIEGRETHDDVAETQ